MPFSACFRATDFSSGIAISGLLSHRHFISMGGFRVVPFFDTVALTRRTTPLYVAQRWNRSRGKW